jgi:hypothetical protein
MPPQAFDFKGPSVVTTLVMMGNAFGCEFRSKSPTDSEMMPPT